jgi:hypothetical protein
MTELDRRTLSFSEAEGLEPLPEPLILGEVSEEARALIWMMIYGSVSRTAKVREDWDYERCLGDDWAFIERDRWVRNLHKAVDEFSPTIDRTLPNLKLIAMHWPISPLFDFLTYVLRHRSCPDGLEEALAQAFTESRMAYSIKDKTIWPTATPEEGVTIQRALVDLSVTEYRGARSHLREASSLLTGGNWAGSIRESIHAVESVARAIEPSAQTLSEALKKLANTGRMNTNLKRGLEALYAYSSDERGIRHAKVYEEVASVDQADAVYMLGACAAFVSFLVARRVEPAKP